MGFEGRSKGAGGMDSPGDRRHTAGMTYNRCGDSGLVLPAISLGIWHNFGDGSPYDTAKAMVLRAFELGITHFDAANNYGPPPGSAEATFGRILREELGSHRDEILVSTKAGYHMWEGPYGEWGSRKHMLASLDQSLKRLGLEYVDIFYHHRPDPKTPLEETMSALDYAVRSGKALYAGISNYAPEETRKAAAILRRLGTPCVIHQAKYSMLVRSPEESLFEALGDEGIGCIAFSPLQKGILTDRYFNGIPSGSRADGRSAFLKASDITEELVAKVRRLDAIAGRRGQKMAQLALAWTLRQGQVASAIIGASSPGQIEECAAALEAGPISEDELREIDAILATGIGA